MNIKIVELDNSFKDKKVIFKYVTDYFYDFVSYEEENSVSFELVKKRFDKSVCKQFESVLLENWLENPILYGAEFNGQLIGFIELSHEQWNNRLRISNIHIDEEYINGTKYNLISKKTGEN